VDSSNYLKGVGGWLKLLVLGLCIFGPLISCGQNANDFARAEASNPSLAGLESWQSFKTYSNWALLLSLSITFSAGYRLWKIHTPESVNFAIAAMWIAAPASVLLQVGAAYLSIGLDALREAAPEMISGVVRGWIVAFVWTMYLLKSRRVRNTYYS